MTLSDIAKTHLGRTARWVQILEINRNVLRDEKQLKIGMVLRLLRTPVEFGLWERLANTDSSL